MFGEFPKINIETNFAISEGITNLSRCTCLSILLPMTLSSVISLGTTLGVVLDRTLGRKQEFKAVLSPNKQNVYTFNEKMHNKELYLRASVFLLSQYTFASF